MPNLTCQSLQHLANVQRAIVYGGDERHPNHVHYDVDQPRALNGASIEQFLSTIPWALRAMNLGVDPKHQFKVHGYWFFCRFADGSNLTPREEQHYAAGMAALVAPDGLAVEFWHRQFFTGAADLNFVVSAVIETPVPAPRRLRDDNLLCRLRRRSDEIVQTFNDERKAAGKPAIPEMQEVQKKRRVQRRESSLELLVAKAAFVMGRTVTVESLPALVEKVGLEPGQWEIDLHRNFCWVRVGSKKSAKKKPAVIRVPLDEFLRGAADELARLIGEWAAETPTKAQKKPASVPPKSPTQIQPDVTQGKASSTDATPPPNPSSQPEL